MKELALAILISLAFSGCADNLESEGTPLGKEPEGNGCKETKLTLGPNGFSRDEAEAASFEVPLSLFVTGTSTPFFQADGIARISLLDEIPDHRVRKAHLVFEIEGDVLSPNPLPSINVMEPFHSFLGPGKFDEGLTLFNGTVEIDARNEERSGFSGATIAIQASDYVNLASENSRISLLSDAARTVDGGPAVSWISYTSCDS